MSQNQPLKVNSPLMIQGTSSNVGKSVLAAAFCRIFYQEGYLTSPFKAQNMALNSFVTIKGGEMGRAQVVQAQAAGREPDVIMNPILLKPTGQASSQVIILGKPQGNLTAMRYHGEYQRKTWPIVRECLEKLIKENEILIIEGAGSPAEVNLKQNDIVNMRVALEINAPVLLVADIDRGGALASVVGTLELLEPRERELVKGIILNKFRGDIKLLQPALDFLVQKTGIPVLGVIPYYTDFSIPEEDSVVLDKELASSQQINCADLLDIVVIRLPFISNFTDFDALRDEPDVQLRYVNKAEDLGNPDLVILPGSKNTLDDLGFLHESGLAVMLKQRWHNSGPVMGICGGYQMMGRLVRDPYHTESNRDEIPGLDILPMETEFYPEKYTVQSQGRIIGNNLFLKRCQGQTVVGYEIHMGRSFADKGTNYLFELSAADSTYLDGLSAGSALGTYLHGIFDNDKLRRSLLEWLWERKGKERPPDNTPSQAALREIAFNQLADLVRRNMDLPALRAIMGL
ncbi:MAG TPA: cobyric acid synthase [Desulfitobacteriaceae bacterium]|nr:cobyric acid synthase [Desulfitobacteriaceae bacterium]